MGNPITVFTGSSGLNVNVDPVRIRFDPETGITDLAACLNVDIDDTGRISRRKGFAATARTEAIHSLWCDGGACLFVTGTSLCELSADFSYSAVTTVTQGARMSYFQMDARSYWMNGFEKGYVENGANNAWVKGSYIGPETTRQLSDPPIGHIIAYEWGYVYVAQGPVIWHSEPFNLGAFDLARNFLPFEDRVTMIKPLSSQAGAGIWVSTEKHTFYLPGQIPRETGPVKTADYPAIEGTDTLIDLAEITPLGITGIGAIWTSTKGICIGTPDGQMLNLTKERLNYPFSARGAGICFDDRYVTSLEP